MDFKASDGGTLNVCHRGKDKTLIAPQKITFKIMKGRYILDLYKFVAVYIIMLKLTELVWEIQLRPICCFTFDSMELVLDINFCKTITYFKAIPVSSESNTF